MILQIVSIIDRAAETFGRPFFVPSLGLAARSFSDEVNRVAEDNQLYNHPEDFDLYHLGSFNDSSAEFAVLDVPVLVERGKTVSTKTNI